MSVRRRRSRVSGRFALSTHQIAARWYQGGRAWNPFQADGSAWKARRWAGVRRSALRCSKL